jgi:hypothetical protein
VHRCSEQGVLWWMRWLLLWRTHPWPHRDRVGPGIVEGGPRRGAPAVVAAVVAGAIVLALPLPLALTLAFAVVVGVLWWEGEGSSEDMEVPTVVGAEVAAAMEGTLHLRARSRTRMPVPRLLSVPDRTSCSGPVEG